MSHSSPRPIAAFDLDGSLFREQLLVLIIKECFELQIFPKVGELAFRDIRRRHRDRKMTHDEYEGLLIDLFNERIKGALCADVEVAARQVVQKNKDWVYIFSRTLLETLRPTHRCIAITGAIEETVKLLSPELGFEKYYATVLATKKGRYTGKNLALPVTEKGAVLAKEIAASGATLVGSVALGDTSSDIPMLSAVETPIAINPSSHLAAEAENRGWPIVIERKDCIFVVAGGRFRRFSRPEAAAAVAFVLQP